MTERRRALLRVTAACGVAIAAAPGCRAPAMTPPPPPAAVASPAPTTAVAAPPTTAPASHLARAIARGVDHLIATQQPNGSWGTGVVSHGNEVMVRVPGSHDSFRSAVTALSAMALREALDAGHGAAPARAAHARAIEYLVTHADTKREDAMLLYDVWAHTYALQALAAESRTNTDPRVASAVRYHLDRLDRYATYMGGWNYYDFNVGAQKPSMGPTSFGTAAALVVLWEARRAGFDVPQRLVDLSLKRLEQMRTPAGAFVYSFDLRLAPAMDANLPRGSVGRTQACNFALRLWGSPAATDAACERALGQFFRDHFALDLGRRRPYPHEAPYLTSGYYYYFGHYYAARNVERLASPDQRAEAQRRLAAHVLPHQDDDGSWWDYPMWDYHKPYGTAFALMTLLRCDPATAGGGGGAVRVTQAGVAERR